MKTRAKPTLSDFSELQNSNAYTNFDKNDLEIPEALVRYHNKLLYSSYVYLEFQLSQVDTDSEIYEKLNTLTNSVFNSWLALGYREGGEKESGCL
jgi:hypothetical protein